MTAAERPNEETMSALDGEFPKGKWKHQPGDLYRLVVSRIVGGPERGYGQSHDVHELAHATRQEAVRQGFRETDSDDFNVGVWRKGRLVAILWMQYVVDDEPDVLAGVTSGYSHWSDAS